MSRFIQVALSCAIVSSAVSADTLQSNIGSLGLGGANFQYLFDLSPRVSTGPTISLLNFGGDGEVSNSASFSGVRTEFDIFQFRNSSLWAGGVIGLFALKGQDASTAFADSLCQRNVYGAYNSILVGGKSQINERFVLGLSAGASVYYGFADFDNCSTILRGRRLYDEIDMAPLLEVLVGYRF